MNLASLTIPTLLEGYRERRFSCVEVVTAYLRRARELQHALNAFLVISHEAALEAARTVDERLAAGEPLRPLEGVPMAIKDVIVTRNTPTTAGSKILDGYVPPYNATVIEKLHTAGAVILGKTNCDEFAMGASGENSGFGPTKNPWDETRVPGGSSSGSAAAVAAGAALAALGSDTGGSIRQPAGFCRVVGAKGTYGRVSRYGLIAMASSLDHIGPIARTVEDAARLFAVIEGKDERDATSVDRQPTDLETVRSGNVRGLRVGVPKEYFLPGMDEQVEAAVRNAAEVLKKEGAVVSEISLPHTEYALAVYYLLQPAEASANLARYDGIRYGKRAAKPAHLIDLYGKTRDQGFGDEVKRRIMLGTYALSAGYYDAYYLKAQRVRTLIRRDFTAAFENVDCILAPTSPSLPFKLGERFSDPITMYLSDIFTVPANIAGIPGISIPVGSPDRLPIGAQLMGPLWSETTMFAVARALERGLGLPLRLPS